MKRPMISLSRAGLRLSASGRLLSRSTCPPGLHSRNGDAWKPCYHTREQLGATIGMSRAKVSRQLKRLREASLLFEVDRGQDPRAHA